MTGSKIISPLTRDRRKRMTRSKHAVEEHHCLHERGNHGSRQQKPYDPKEQCPHYSNYHLGCIGIGQPVITFIYVLIKLEYQTRDNPLPPLITMHPLN